MCASFFSLSDVTHNIHVNDDDITYFLRNNYNIAIIDFFLPFQGGFTVIYQDVMLRSFYSNVVEMDHF